MTPLLAAFQTLSAFVQSQSCTGSCSGDVRFGKDLLRIGGGILLRLVIAGPLLDAGTRGKTCLCTLLEENLGKIVLRCPIGADSLSVLNMHQRRRSCRTMLARGRFEDRRANSMLLRCDQGESGLLLLEFLQ